MFVKIPLVNGPFIIVLYRKYIGRLYTDCLVHDEKALKFLVETIGEVTIRNKMIVKFNVFDGEVHTLAQNDLEFVEPLYNRE